jgi:sortase A
MTKKILPWLVILLGIILILYPTAKDRYESYQQQKILEQWQANLQQIEEVSSEAPVEDSANYSIAPEESNPIIAPTVDPQKIKPVVKSLSAAQKASQDYMKKHVEGVLTIDKINLKLPILTNATQKNLALSLASIANTGKPGAIGNYAIAGHRNFTYGKNFNRLDEVVLGDLIEVDTGEKHYWYKVSEKQYVLPTDVQVLEGNGKDREITLITCHPMKNPTHRLIIKGILMDHKE